MYAHNLVYSPSSCMPSFSLSFSLIFISFFFILISFFTCFPLCIVSHTKGRYPIGVIMHVDVATPEHIENNVCCSQFWWIGWHLRSFKHQQRQYGIISRPSTESPEANETMYRIFSFREEIERQEVQQAKERERESEKARQKQGERRGKTS